MNKYHFVIHPKTVLLTPCIKHIKYNNNQRTKRWHFGYGVSPTLDTLSRMMSDMNGSSREVLWVLLSLGSN